MSEISTVQTFLNGPAIAAPIHPSLPPECAVTDSNRVLEIRYFWNTLLLDILHFFEPKRVTLGDEKDVDILTDLKPLPVGKFPFVRFLAGHYVLAIPDSMEGEIEFNQKLYSFGELKSSKMAQRDQSLPGSFCIVMPTSSRAVMHWQEISLAMRFVPPANAIPKRALKDLEQGYLITLTSAFFFMFSLAALLSIYPYDAEELRTDDFDRASASFLRILEPPRDVVAPTDSLKRLRQEKPKENPPEVLKPLAAPIQNKNLFNQPVTERDPPKSKRTEQIREKFQSFFEGTLLGDSPNQGEQNNIPLSKLLRDAVMVRGFPTNGIPAIGTRGPSPLGQMGTYRPAGLEIAGPGSFGPLTPNYGNRKLSGDPGGFVGRRPQGILTLDPPKFEGALKKEVILKVIKDNLGQIRYCYELELQKNQTLEGRVKIQWVIGATGEVAKVQVQESTLGNDAVVACMMRKIGAWRFPEPAGGGVVNVVYPWVLKSS